MQNRLGVHFVHILPARTGGTRIGEVQFVVGNLNLIVNFQHASNTSGQTDSNAGATWTQMAGDTLSSSID